MSSCEWAANLAVDYLGAMEARDLDAARRLVAPGDLDIVFPGGRRFTRIEEIVANSSGRYRIVKKRITGCTAWESGPRAHVMITGTLYGEWPDGAPFEGIRFCDWFELQDGLIVKQHVWNDAGERLLALGRGTEA
ncbi:hypothetical protein DLJ53_12725 [Acuticoccus sediminis]|uniref:SnoaL-like domain-containing protein n=1 Tax=Acuticoccus sediminis TaxID=2184697 RepID=A0A8B2NXG3_9HYPH|nr:nuclear transport factor 2 family protein [Acuticoccus sediminis]RAI02224.1 hypothetical protein DLJ53_12725 [Acuticoccus sediminis]